MHHASWLSIMHHASYIADRKLRFGMLMNQGVMVDGRRLLVEDNLRWKTTFGGRQPLVEDDRWWKTTFCGRQPLLKDDLRWKTTIIGRHPAVGHCGSLHAAYSALWHFYLVNKTF